MCKYLGHLSVAYEKGRQTSQTKLLGCGCDVPYQQGGTFGLQGWMWVQHVPTQKPEGQRGTVGG